MVEEEKENELSNRNRATPEGVQSAVE